MGEADSRNTKVVITNGKLLGEIPGWIKGFAAVLIQKDSFRIPCETC